jgi:thymidylate synthase (FAD)
MRVIKPEFVIEDDINGEEILKKIEKAGRTCYKSEDKITADSAKRFIKKILAMGHESVIEHEKVSVRVICDRGVTTGLQATARSPRAIVITQRISSAAKYP